MEHDIILQTPLLSKEFITDLYKASYIEVPHFKQVFGPNNRRWHDYMDVKSAVMEPKFLIPIAKNFAAMAENVGAKQVATMGFGAAGVVGAIVQESKKLGGVIMRDEKRDYGNTNPILARHVDEEICVVDDILNSGGSVMKAITLLRTAGAKQIAVFTIFEFDKGRGRKVLEEEGIKLISLAKLKRHNHKDDVRIPTLTTPQE